MVLVQALSIGIMLSTLALLWIKRIALAIRLLSFQSLLLGMMAGQIAFATHATQLYVMAGVTILLKALVVPWIMLYTMRTIGIHRETEKLIGRELSVLMGALLLMVAYVVTLRFHVSSGTNAQPYLPVSLAMLLIGLFIMMIHQKAIMQGIGLVVMENGLFLAALVTTHGLPFLVDMGVALDVLIAVIIISMLTYRIDRVFRSTHTENLRKLRG